MDDSNMRIALGQLDMVWEDKETSFIKSEKMIAEAAEQNCDIIIFPEMSFTGFSMNLAKIGESPEHSETKEKMGELAVRYGIAIAFGWAALGDSIDEKGTNRFTLLDTDGTEVLEYTKLHPFTYGGESDYYAKGTEIKTASFMGRTVGLFICYDLRFPEIFSAAAKEADIFFVIANWPSIRSAHWETLLRARAIENQAYVAGVNCTGERDGISYAGGSMAVDSIGNVLGKLSDDEDILICDLDDRAWNLRNKFNIADDRRISFYKSVM